MNKLFCVLHCVQFQLQSFEIVCNTTWASDDSCCDLPAVVRLLIFTSVLHLLCVVDTGFKPIYDITTLFEGFHYLVITESECICRNG